MPVFTRLQLRRRLLLLLPQRLPSCFSLSSFFSPSSSRLPCSLSQPLFSIPRYLSTPLASLLSPTRYRRRSPCLPFPQPPPLLCYQAIRSQAPALVLNDVAPPPSPPPQSATLMPMLPMPSLLLSIPVSILFSLSFPRSAPSLPPPSPHNRHTECLGSEHDCCQSTHSPSLSLSVSLDSYSGYIICSPLLCGAATSGSGIER